MHEQRMLELAHALAVAKSRQDVPAALRLFHPDMVLETPAFGTTARGLTENEKALRRFFASFPDYDVALHGRHPEPARGRGLRLTMTGNRFGVLPNRERAEIPVFIQFTFKDDLIAGERFFFDLATLCAQSGVSTDAVRQRLFPALTGGDAA